MYVGSRRVEVELVSKRLVGETPPGAGPGAVNVKVLDPTCGTEVLEGGFEYILTLGPDAVVPNRFPTDGGVEVTVTGCGFDEHTRVSFGGVTGLASEPGLVLPDTSLEPVSTVLNDDLCGVLNRR